MAFFGLGSGGLYCLWWGSGRHSFCICRLGGQLLVLLTVEDDGTSSMIAFFSVPPANTQMSNITKEKQSYKHTVCVSLAREVYVVYVHPRERQPSVPGQLCLTSLSFSQLLHAARRKQSFALRSYLSFNPY